MKSKPTVNEHWLKYNKKGETKKKKKKKKEKKRKETLLQPQ